MEIADEYRIKVTVRNNLILKVIEAHGYKSLKFFAEINNINYSRLANLVALREAPLGSSGEFSLVARQLMEILGAAPHDLWSDEQLTMALRKNSSEATVGSYEFSTLFNRLTGQIEYDSPDEAADKANIAKVVAEQLDSLTPREAKVLRMRFGIGCDDMTLEEIGASFGVTRERIRQIEAKAVRKLKQINRRDILAPLVSDDAAAQVVKKNAALREFKKATKELFDAEAARTLEVRAMEYLRLKHALPRVPSNIPFSEHLKKSYPDVYENLKNEIDIRASELAEHTYRLRASVPHGREGAQRTA